jgi:hypothetical protein
MKRGWEVGIHFVRQRASAFAEWHSKLRCDKAIAGEEAFDEHGVEMSARGDTVWNALQELAPKGWLPESSDDPIIVAAFDRGWPISPSDEGGGEQY